MEFNAMDVWSGMGLNLYRVHVLNCVFSCFVFVYILRNSILFVNSFPRLEIEVWHLILLYTIKQQIHHEVFTVFLTLPLISVFVWFSVIFWSHHNYYSFFRCVFIFCFFFKKCFSLFILCSECILFLSLTL